LVAKVPILFNEYWLYQLQILCGKINAGSHLFACSNPVWLVAKTIEEAKTIEDLSCWLVVDQEEPQQYSARLTHDDGSGCDFYHRMTFDLLLGLADDLEIPTDQDIMSHES